MHVWWCVGYRVQGVELNCWVESKLVRLRCQSRSKLFRVGYRNWLLGSPGALGNYICLTFQMNCANFCMVYTNMLLNQYKFILIIYLLAKQQASNLFASLPTLFSLWFADSYWSWLAKGNRTGDTWNWGRGIRNRESVIPYVDLRCAKQFVHIFICDCHCASFLGDSRPI